MHTDVVALLVGFGEQADDSRGDGLRVIVVHEHAMGADEFWNRTTVTDDYGSGATHGFGDDHAKGFRVTNLDVDFGSLQPTDDVHVLHGADEINVCLNSQVGNESAQLVIGVAFVSDDDKRLLRKGLENDGQGAKKDFPALDAEDMVIEIEDSGDVRAVAIRSVEGAGIDAVRDDDGIASAQFRHVFEHKARDDQDGSGEAETQASSKFFIPGGREIAGRNAGHGVAIEHGVVTSSNDDDGLAGEAGFDERQDAPTGPPGEIEIATPRNFCEGRGDGYVVSQVMKNADVLEGILLLLELGPIFVGEEARGLGSGHAFIISQRAVLP